MVASLLTLVNGEATPKFPNPYNMMDKGMARPYMGKTFGVNTYTNYAYGYVVPRYGYYPAVVPVVVDNIDNTV